MSIKSQYFEVIKSAGKEGIISRDIQKILPGKVGGFLVALQRDRLIEVIGFRKTSDKRQVYVYAAVANA